MEHYKILPYPYGGEDVSSQFFTLPGKLFLHRPIQSPVNLKQEGEKIQLANWDEHQETKTILGMELPFSIIQIRRTTCEISQLDLVNLEYMVGSKAE